jgi:hypothetical protein
VEKHVYGVAAQLGTCSEKRQADVFPNKIDLVGRIPQTDTVRWKALALRPCALYLLAVASFAVLNFRLRLLLLRSAIAATAAARKSAVRTPINYNTTIFFDRQ